MWGGENVDFKTMELFNLSLLAKQGCRLIQNLSGLNGQILKAMYYLNDDFFNYSTRGEAIKKI